MQTTPTRMYYQLRITCTILKQTTGKIGQHKQAISRQTLEILLFDLNANITTSIVIVIIIKVISTEETTTLTATILTTPTEATIFATTTETTMGTTTTRILDALRLITHFDLINLRLINQVYLIETNLSFDPQIPPNSTEIITTTIPGSTATTFKIKTMVLE